MTTDTAHMSRALALAMKGLGAVEPNPMVGAVITDAAGAVVGEGYHARFGGPHAEVMALNQALGRALGGTLVVTLEPCCHHGKTPPCTDAVIAAGIARVVVAMRDPFPKVDGGGIKALMNTGITVEVGVSEQESRALNASYLQLQEQKKPWVHAKWAMSLDGKIATRTGNSQWITSEQSRAVVHELRGRMDAIVVGAGTLREDDPLLTARPPGPRVATRVVLSASGKLPAACQLLSTIKEAPVMIATGHPEVEELNIWRKAGAEVLAVNGIEELLIELGRRQFTNVLVEGGAHLLGAFWDSNCVNEVHTFMAPIVIGGTTAPSPVAGVGIARLKDGITLEPWQVVPLGPDIYCRARVRPRH